MELIKQHRGLVAGIATLAIIGALWAGVPLSTLLLFGLLLACPLMMLSMHGGGGHGGHSNADHSGSTDTSRSPYRPSGAPPETDPHAGHRHPTDSRPW